MILFLLKELIKYRINLKNPETEKKWEISYGNL
jgi:hypothetical protein